MYAVFYLVISLAQFETVVPWQQLIELLPAEIDELDNVTSAGDQPSSALNDNGVTQQLQDCPNHEVPEH